MLDEEHCRHPELAAGSEPLRDAESTSASGAARPIGGVPRKHTHQSGGAGHQADDEDEHSLTSVRVTAPSEDDGAERPHQERRAVQRERREEHLVVVREEDGTMTVPSAAVDGEVVPLHRVPDTCREQGASRRAGARSARVRPGEVTLDRLAVLPIIRDDAVGSKGRA